MFFVADGDDHRQGGVASPRWRAFLNALQPGLAGSLMAFMEGSSGYEVHGLRFPAVR